MRKFVLVHEANFQFHVGLSQFIKIYIHGNEMLIPLRLLLYKNIKDIVLGYNLSVSGTVGP